MGVGYFYSQSIHTTLSSGAGHRLATRAHLPNSSFQSTRRSRPAAPPESGCAPMSLTSECLVRQCLHRLPPTCRADCSAHGVHQLGRPSLADPRFHAGAPACTCPPLSAYGTGGLFAGRSPGGSNGQKSLGTANEQGSRRTQRHGRPARRAPRCDHGGAVWPRASSAGARMIHGCDATGDRARRHRPACRPAPPSVRADGGRPVPHGVCAGQQDGSTRGPVARQQGQVTHSLLGVHISSCTRPCARLGRRSLPPPHGAPRPHQRLNHARWNLCI